MAWSPLQPKKQDNTEVEGDRKVGEKGLDKIWKRRGGKQYWGIFIKRGLGPLCYELCKETKNWGGGGEEVPRLWPMEIGKVETKESTAWKVFKYGVFSSPYFPVFRLNTEIYQVNLRKNSVFNTFHAVDEGGGEGKEKKMNSLENNWFSS